MRQKKLSLILDLELLIEKLKREPGDEIFRVRRQIEKCRANYLKQGNAVPIVKKFEITCSDCEATMSRADDYYLHLRKSHNYSDEDASKMTVIPQQNYEQSLQQLEALLTEFTDHYLEEPNSGSKPTT